MVLEVQEAWHVTDRMRGKSRAEKALAIPGAAAERHAEANPSGPAFERLVA